MRQNAEGVVSTKQGLKEIVPIAFLALPYEDEKLVFHGESSMFSKLLPYNGLSPSKPLIDRNEIRRRFGLSNAHETDSECQKFPSSFW